METAERIKLAASRRVRDRWSIHRRHGEWNQIGYSPRDRTRTGSPSGSINRDPDLGSFPIPVSNRSRYHL
ncbi:hypothetical protein HPP92_002199 [Vanilla planifolia]|uniref:Uncharacterized protein n=1 Tax=Vanilla planifolia TaxID=51239 RepID=A0A835S506_VANPL|nr:hypothetical protein HPP92_002199 [Vanilla planifolia]